MNRIFLLFMMSCISFAFSYGQDAKGDVNKGQELFKANCTACHALDKQLVGPALHGIEAKIKQEQNLDREWLYKWIKDNKSLRASGDKYANEIFEQYGKSEMTVFSNFTNQDIDDILAYIENPPKQEDDKTADTVALVKAEELKQQQNDNKLMLIGVSVIGVILLVSLFKLNKLVSLKIQGTELSEYQKKQIVTFSNFYQKQPAVFYSAVAIVMVFALYGFWAWLMGIGVDKGYQPDQPIYFSHKIHAGENGIDCQLCHSGAKYGKVSEIPSLSVCMNCHRNISEYKGKYIEPGKTRDFYTSEIKKIYEHVGWDEQNQTYTGVHKPVKWTRIHNMPDFVYFNHSQHVVAGEKTIIEDFNKKHPNQQIDVVCKACHGQVDTMNVVKMANDFTMGWCVDCHRTTRVDMTNGYNSAYYQKLHDKLKKQYGNDKSKITVDAIGGLECGKCHY